MQNFVEDINKAADAAEAVEKSKQSLNRWLYGDPNNSKQLGAEARMKGYEREASKLRELASEETDKIKRQNLLTRAKKEQAKADEIAVSWAEWEYQIAVDTNSLTESTIKDKQKVSEAYNKLAEAQEKAANNARMYNRQLTQSWSEIKKTLNEISKLQLIVDKLGIKVIVTQENKDEIAKEVETALIGLNVMNDKPLVFDVPVKPEIDEEQLETVDFIDQFGKFNTDLQKYAKDTGQSYEGVFGKIQKVALKSNKSMEEVFNKAKELAKNLNSTIQDFFQNGIVSAFDAIGDALVSGDWSNVLVSMLDSIGSALKSFGSTLIAYAIAVEAFKQCFANPYAAVAAGAALIIAGAALSAAASKLQKFETGGIVGGTSYYGDNVLARVNSGEMILNQGQQRNLFDAINSGNFGGGSNTVEFKVSGSNLYGVLNNYNTRRSKL